MKICLLLPLFLVACSTEQHAVKPQSEANSAYPGFIRIAREARTERAEKYLRDHPDTGPEMIGNFEAGRLSVGMDKEQVEVVLGRPDRRYATGGVGSSYESWHYPGSTVTFRDGLLVQWGFER